MFQLQPEILFAYYITGNDPHIAHAGIFSNEVYHDVRAITFCNPQTVEMTHRILAGLLIDGVSLSDVIAIYDEALKVLEKTNQSSPQDFLYGLREQGDKVLRGMPIDHSYFHSKILAQLDGRAALPGNLFRF